MLVRTFSTWTSVANPQCIDICNWNLILQTDTSFSSCDFQVDFSGGRHQFFFCSFYLELFKLISDVNQIKRKRDYLLNSQNVDYSNKKRIFSTQFWLAHSCKQKLSKSCSTEKKKLIEKKHNSLIKKNFTEKTFDFTSSKKSNTCYNF